MSGEFEPNDSRNVTGTASTPDGRWTGQGQQPPLAGGQSPQPTGPREHETREGGASQERWSAQGGGGAGGGGLSQGDDDSAAGGLSNEGAGEDMENRNAGSGMSGSSQSGTGPNIFTGPSGGQSGNSQAGFGSAGEGSASQGANQATGGQGGSQGMGSDQSLGQANESGWPEQMQAGQETGQSQQAGSIGEQIREHMRVVDAQGTEIGRVDSFENDQIKLTRADSSDGQHHYLSIDHVAGVDGDCVRLHQSGGDTFGSNGS